MLVSVSKNKIRHLQKSACDEDGAILPFTVVIFLLMVIMTGMAIAYMRHETFRSEMQNALDRGLLAAADLDSDLTDEEAEALVKEYFSSALWVGDKVVPEVDVVANNVSSPGGYGYRELTGSARYNMNTFFMGIIGYDTLPVYVSGGAADRKKNVEISFLFDISGTMRWCDEDLKDDACANPTDEYDPGRRVNQAIDAATDFIDTIFAGGVDTTSVSFVPYAGEVNIGPELFALLGGRQRNLAEGGIAWGLEESNPENLVDSYCFEISNGDYNQLAFPKSNGNDQVPHFMAAGAAWRPDREPYMENMTGWGWCPTGEDTYMTIHSNDPDALKQQVTNMRYSLHDGTSTDIAAIWAAALLDPSARDLLNDNDLIEGSFDNDRPADYDDPDTVKVMVVLTDGNINHQWRPKPGRWDHIDNLNMALQWQTETPGVAAEKAGWDYRHLDVDKGKKREHFEKVCELAKDQNIEIYTIAFEAPSGARENMKNCATNENTHYYYVEDEGVSVAFEEISIAVTKIRLTQ